MKKTFPVIVSILALAGSAHSAIVFDYQANLKQQRAFTSLKPPELP